jgi:spermidine synthase
MTSLFIYIAIVVSGASVLAIEMLGTRILGPFYGVSLYLWSALISVTLAALSLGYAIGGRWADRGPSIGRFSSVIGLAGLWIVAVPWMRDPVLAATESAGLRTAVLVTATVLFFPPLTLLGMVSPYAIRLKASSLKVVGRTAGNLYAISTVASVVAAVATGFILIPNLGVNEFTLAIGYALLVVGLIGMVTARSARAGVAALLLLPAAGIAIFVATPSSRVRANPDAGLLAIDNSPYAEIRVVEEEGTRYMLIDGGTHTIVDAETGESLFPYVDVLDIARDFFAEPGKMVLVGLGGGSVVKRFAGADWTVDAVEIDPVVTKVARAHFGLEDSEATVHHMDGRRYFNVTADNYDLVIMDAFGSSSIPFHLVTKEAFALIRSRLTEGGILAMNIEATAWHDVLVHSLAATMQQVFAHVVVLPMAEPPNTLGNLVLLASDRALELDEEPPVPSYRFSREYHRSHAWDNRFTVDPDGVPILTDDHNPVDIWAERINLVARKRLHEHFDRSLGW